MQVVYENYYTKEIRFSVPRGDTYYEDEYEASLALDRELAKRAKEKEEEEMINPPLSPEPAALENAVENVPVRSQPSFRERYDRLDYVYVNHARYEYLRRPPPHPLLAGKFVLTKKELEDFANKHNLTPQERARMGLDKDNRYDRCLVPVNFISFAEKAEKRSEKDEKDGKMEIDTYEKARRCFPIGEGLCEKKNCCEWQIKLQRSTTRLVRMGAPVPTGWRDDNDQHEWVIRQQKNVKKLQDVLGSALKKKDKVELQSLINIADGKTAADLKQLFEPTFI